MATERHGAAHRPPVIGRENGDLSPARGTYVLVLPADRGGAVKVGRLGVLELRRGYYLYVGSALGAGGLPARLGHHLRGTARPRWHIDYLRRHLAVREIWYAADGRRRESAWARAIGALPGMSAAMAGFGASDCRGEEHLFYSRRRPRLADFAAAVGTSAEEAGLQRWMPPAVSP